MEGTITTRPQSMAQKPHTTSLARMWGHVAMWPHLPVEKIGTWTGQCLELC